MFKDGIIYEGVKPRPPHNGWNTHYTSNAGWLLCSMTGLYPVPSPAGQYIITSPSLAKTVIHNGNNLITVEALNNSEENIYISEIKVNGKVYPSYLIPASKLVSGVTISLVMSNDPESRPGNLYISSTDGFVESAGLISGSQLKCIIKAPIIGAITKIYCAYTPAGMSINGKKQEAFDFDPATHLLTIQTKDKASIEVTLK
jgi:hypothetical protein